MEWSNEGRRRRRSEGAQRDEWRSRRRIQSALDLHIEHTRLFPCVDQFFRRYDKVYVRLLRRRRRMKEESWR